MEFVATHNFAIFLYKLVMIAIAYIHPKKQRYWTRCRKVKQFLLLLQAVLTLKQMMESKKSKKNSYKSTCYFLLYIFISIDTHGRPETMIHTFAFAHSSVYNGLWLRNICSHLLYSIHSNSFFFFGSSIHLLKSFSCFVFLILAFH